MDPVDEDRLVVQKLAKGVAVGDVTVFSVFASSDPSFSCFLSPASIKRYAVEYQAECDVWEGQIVDIEVMLERYRKDLLLLKDMYPENVVGEV